MRSAAIDLEGTQDWQSSMKTPCSFDYSDWAAEEWKMNYESEDLL